MGHIINELWAEYIREIEIRAEALVAAFKSSFPTS
jgi:hypothetical protein